MFDLKFLSGDPRTALKEPNTVVLTESLAKKYFADEDPIGKTLLNENREQSFQITGVILDMPRNTHMKIDYMISMPSFASIMGNAEMLNHRTWKAVFTYVLLQLDQTAESFDAKVPAFMKSFHADYPGRQEEILRHSAVSHVALASNLPGGSFSNERLTPVSVADKSSLPMLRFIRVDEDFIETAGLDIIKGRNFNRASDQKGAYIIAESVAEVLHLELPLGVECRSDVHGDVEPIVGVIKDFHFASLHNKIEPLVLEYRPGWTGYLCVKVERGRFGEVLEFLNQKFDEVAPDHLFNYVFADEYFSRNYENENRSYSLFRIFAMIALLVACLGLFGLTVYAAEIRVKEIGIRKVLGASIPSITVMMSKEFILWVIIANAIAWPAAYLAMNKWLENFAYRIHIHVWTFVFSAALVLLFALATVSYQAVRAAVSNPIESLRYE